MKLLFNSFLIVSQCHMLNRFAMKNKLKKVTSELGNGGTVQEKYKSLMIKLVKIRF